MNLEHLTSSMQINMVHKLRCRGCQSYDTMFTNSVIEDELIYCRECGLTSFIWPKTHVDYNYEYVASRYDKYPTTEAMSALRMQMVMSVIELHDNIMPKTYHDPPKRGKLLDVGYGNGSFIRMALGCQWSAYGYDVNPAKYDRVKNVPLPTKIDTAYDPWYRVITFFDSLEHFESLAEVRKVSLFTDWIFVSYPKPPAGFPFLQPGELEKWKHFRPGEHHHYFTPKSLHALFSNPGVRCEVVYRSAIEDSIRGAGLDGTENIETVAIRCHPDINER